MHSHVGCIIARVIVHTSTSEGVANSPCVNVGMSKKVSMALSRLWCTTDDVRATKDQHKDRSQTVRSVSVFACALSVEIEIGFIAS